MSGHHAGPSQHSSRTIASKKMIIEEFKKRLRDNIKSLNDNFCHILAAAKVNNDDDSYKNITGKMAEFYTTKNEMAVRAQLMVKASEDLLKLTADLKEFLILHDFHYLTHNIKKAESHCEKEIRQQTHLHNVIDANVNNLINDLDREIGENFFLRHG